MYSGDNLDPEKLSYAIRAIQLASNIHKSTRVVLAYYDVNIESKESLSKIRKMVGLPSIPEESIKDLSSAWGFTLRGLNEILEQLQKKVNVHHFHEYRKVIYGKLSASFNRHNQIEIQYLFDPKKEKNQPETGDLVIERMDDGFFVLEKIGDGMLGIYDSEEDIYDYVDKYVEDNREIIVVFSRRDGYYEPIMELKTE